MDIIRKYWPTFLIIMETRTSFMKTKQFWNRAGYVDVFVDAHGHAGGI
jgi:hypothetical protein